MTEFTKIKDILALSALPEAIQRFILHWGDMGSTWGVNRTVAQIHALLFIMEQPLNAEQITEILGVARSNVSNSLKELLGFKTIRRVPIAGDRRDYFTAETDVWEVAKRIAAVRKAREIDPALETLTYCLKAAEGDTRVSAEQRKRLQDMADFTATMDRWYGQMQTLPTGTLTKLISMGDRVVGLLNIGRKK
jgi:DNA-binding transcriptional regulator GbsR (MarR family)